MSKNSYLIFLVYTYSTFPINQLFHSDLGDYYEVYWKVRITYDDTTFEVREITEFISNLQEPLFHAITEKVVLQYDGNTATWTENGTPITVNTLLVNLEEINCNLFPINFNTNLVGNTCDITLVTGVLELVTNIL